MRCGNYVVVSLIFALIFRWGSLEFVFSVFCSCSLEGCSASNFFLELQFHIISTCTQKLLGLRTKVGFSFQTNPGPPSSASWQSTVVWQPGTSKSLVVKSRACLASWSHWSNGYQGGVVTNNVEEFVVFRECSKVLFRIPVIHPMQAGPPAACSSMQRLWLQRALHRWNDPTDWQLPSAGPRQHQNQSQRWYEISEIVVRPECRTYGALGSQGAGPRSFDQQTVASKTTTSLQRVSCVKASGLLGPCFFRSRFYLNF